MTKKGENVETDCCLDIIMIAVELNMDKERVRDILQTNLNMRKSGT
jgi:hypothetical protein